MIFLSPCIFILFYIIARPISRRIFATWPLFGIPVGMILGGLFWSWTIWIFCHFRAPLTTSGVWSSLIFTAGLSLVLDRYFSEAKIFSQLKKEAISTVICFFSFLLLTSIYILFRRHNADFVGLEKFPDLAFFTSAYKATALPPLDPFAAGETINYYYFGHFQAALMAHLHGRLPFEVFHYQVANIFTLSILIMSTTGYFLYRWAIDANNNGMAILAGAVASFIGLLGGNLQPVFEHLILRRKNYFYPSATRYIENVIHEFPFYSFIVGDLHGHLMNLPNAILAIGFCALLFERLNHIQELHWRTLTQRNVLVILSLIAFSAATSYVTNAWDIMTTLLLAGFTMVAVVIFKNKLTDRHSYVFLLCASVLLVAGSILFYLPYWLHFSPPAQGLALVPPGKSTPIIQLALIWGVHVPFVFMLKAISSQNSQKYFLNTLAYLSLGLIVALEFIYFKDIYPAHFRANTVFKIGFQVWIWLSLLGGVVLAGLMAAPKQRVVLSNIAIFLVGCAAYYTWLAPQQATSHFAIQYSLDGRDMLRRSAPEDIRLIDWINDNLTGQQVILEATGDSFSEFGRVSAFTGNPTIVQWPVHEWLWRGSYDRPLRPPSHLPREYTDTVANRVEDVRRFYEAPNTQEARHILSKYNVKYFVLGRLERQKYSKLNETLLSTLGSIVFQDGHVALYKVEASDE